MYVRQYLRRVSLFILKTINRLTLYKLIVLIFSALILYTIIVIWNEEEDITPLFDLAGEDNITREVLSETKNPAIIWWTPGNRLFDETIECPNNRQCDTYGASNKLPPNTNGAYLFYASKLKFSDLPLPRQPEKVIWGLYHEESPRNVVELLYEEGLNLFNFSSTFSRYSDISFPLQHMESIESITSKTYFVTTVKKNELRNKIAPVIFMSSNCFTFSDRDDYVKELMKYIDVDSYGTCLNNKKWPKNFPEDHLNNLNDDMILNFVARYKFAIAIENGVCEDYVTEKFWRPIKLGVVPIYFGSLSIKDWFPNNKSAILTEDFPSPKALSEHLYKLLQNDTLYEEYLHHKTIGLISNKRLLNEIKERPYQLNFPEMMNEFECFICKKLHDMKWSAEAHVVTKSHYNCSKPISALTGKTINSLQPFWIHGKKNAKLLYKKIRSTT